MLERFRPLRIIDPDTLERGLRLVMLEGVAAQIMVVLTGGAFLVAFALELGASPFTIGLLGALQPLTQTLQIPTIYLVERLGWRKLVVVVALALSRAFCFVLAAIPWVVPEPQRIPVFIGALLAYYGLGTVSGVAWNPWLRDLIPENRLGQYMAGRLAWITGIGALLGLAAAGGIDLYQRRFDDLLGVFSLYFAVAGVVGLFGVSVISRVPEPRAEHNPAHPIWRLIAEPLHDANFRQLLRFLASWNFAVNFAAPFFTVYMLRRLGLTMTVILSLTVLSQAINVVFFRIWGRLADRFSYKSTLVEAGPLFIVTFVLWPLTQFGQWPGFTLAALIFIYVLNGMSTAGVQLCTGNLALKLAPKGKATAYLAINALTSGVAATFAPILGGIAATFFEGEEITFVVRWRSTFAGTEGDFVPFTLRGLDFVFLLAFVLGLYSLHRLVTIKEQGEVEKGLVRPELQYQVRKAIDHVSTVDGLRDLFSFPYGRLIEVFNRRRVRRRPGQEPTPTVRH
ncbi:MFS transporter [Sulfurifustis variabilis]|uniref:MFS transporter n=1 Tax=Sulfurifustis variabilis TaxID=1675686 RepID=A0A1B4V6R6_9GAMM|nr:MFS transporter [Sulfurifustis variabilis]BAU48272.1 MFS transporter [Sulfurifustis variabilis]